MIRAVSKKPDGPSMVINVIVEDVGTFTFYVSCLPGEGESAEDVANSVTQAIVHEIIPGFFKHGVFEGREDRMIIHAPSRIIRIESLGVSE